tara:strand:- start:1087 stop:2829 length:1743 start_codon:yes stop_codon:yes gene_type:complete
LKASDYISNRLLKYGINTAYAVTGGAAVHILDSFDLKGGNLVFFHHEQSASLAVGSHYKASGNIATCIVTSGPGVTNAITGLVACWLDSVPSLFISGQSRLDSLIGDRTGVRQRGNQEVETKKLVEHHCKRFIQPSSIDDLKYIIEEAIEVCKEGRPGPVWIDLPLDLQWANLNIDNIEEYKFKAKDSEELEESSIPNIIHDLQKSNKPIIILGTGIKVGGAENELREVLKKIDIPLLSTWGGIGLVEEHSENFIGRPGPLGNRSANKILLESDLIIAIGTHLRSQIIGPSGTEDLSQTKFYTVHIDQNEDFHINLKNKKFIKEDAKVFLKKLNDSIKLDRPIKKEKWNSYCNNIKKLDEIKTEIPSMPGRVDPYELMKYVSKSFYGKCNYVVDGGGTVTQMGMQSLKASSNQNIILSNGLTLMGSGLPEAIGAFRASQKPVIVFIGEGSLQFNIQELATIKYHNMKIIILVIDNGGYLSIQNTQKQFLEGRTLGTGNDSGLCFPNLQNITNAYGLNFDSIKSEKDFHKLEDIFIKSLPTLIEVSSNTYRMVEPRVAFKYSKELGKNITLPLSLMDPQLD